MNMIVNLMGGEHTQIERASPVINGNGRHSRLMADIIIESVFNKDVFPWHSSNMVKPDETRKQYIAAIRAGDRGNIQPLIEFARN